MYRPQGEPFWTTAVWEGQLLARGLGQPQRGLPPRFSPSSQEPSPYDESEMHDSFHQLIQEQSQWAAEEGLELQQMGSGTSGEPAWPRPRWWDAVGRALNPLILPGCPSQQSAGLGQGWVGEITIAGRCVPRTSGQAFLLCRQ